MTLSPRARLIQSIRWALHAIRHETRPFAFEEVLAVNLDAAGSDSLHYHIYDMNPSWSSLTLDAEQVALFHTRTIRPCYHPAYIAWWGLMNLGEYLRGANSRGLDRFLKQVNWLVSRAEHRPDGAVVWPTPYDEYLEGTYLKAGWISGYTQGLVMSALIRAYRVTRFAALLPPALGAARVYGMDVEHGGIRTVCDGHVLYDECPGYRAPGILDGFMTSLLGLHDLFIQTRDPVVFGLFRDGIAGLKHTLPRWDYRGKWSWYGSHAYLATAGYHVLHCLQLRALATLASEPAFSACARDWSSPYLTRRDRLEIFAVLLLTKNRSRLKHRTWRRPTVQAYQRSHAVQPHAVQRPVSDAIPGDDEVPTFVPRLPPG